MKVLTIAMGTQAVPFISLPEGTLGRVCCVQGYGARGRGGLRVEKEGIGVGIARVTPQSWRVADFSVCPGTHACPVLSHGAGQRLRGTAARCLPKKASRWEMRR